ncbi:MAG: aa3-type cytochrome c oxidase subunit IV [Sphingosinicella sp.]|nr:aa3-type cytochrome c oxidase subunit IV [Sphingosinicella sp.]
MAAESEAHNDYQAHSKGYERFLVLMKWGTILSAITGAVFVLIIAS